VAPLVLLVSSFLSLFVFLLSFALQCYRAEGQN
jgi:hypothetical protein